MPLFEGNEFDAEGIKTIYGAIEKGNDIVLVYDSVFKGKDYFTIRAFYQDRASGHWRPTQKGLTFSEDVQIQDLLQILSNVVASSIT